MSFDVQVPCPCPGTPHPDGDTVGLREKLGLAAGIAVQQTIIQAPKDNVPALVGQMAEVYLLYGVESWTLVDEGGREIPVNEAAIRHRLLGDFALAAPIADAADGLYSQQVVDPLVKGAQTSLRSTPTNGSTSVPRSGTSKRPKPSRPSSTTTTPTDSTEKTSPALVGASRS